jgi:hypothetical protein
MLGAELGLPVTHLDSHASYIGHWLKLLKDDDRAILTAAAKAEEASTLLLKLGGRASPTSTRPAPPRWLPEGGHHGPIGQLSQRRSIVAFTVLEVEDSDDWEFEYEWLRDDLSERAARAFPVADPARRLARPRGSDPHAQRLCRFRRLGLRRPGRRLDRRTR